MRTEINCPKFIIKMRNHVLIQVRMKRNLRVLIPKVRNILEQSNVALRSNDIKEIYNQYFDYEELSTDDIRYILEYAMDDGEPILKITGNGHPRYSIMK